MLCMLVLVPVSGVSAVSEKTDEIGYDTYTYWYNFTGKTRKAVYSKPMYEVSTVLTAADLGCVSGSSLTDVHTTENGITYLLDGERNFRRYGRQHIYSRYQPRARHKVRQQRQTYKTIQPARFAPYTRRLQLSADKGRR